MQKRNIADVSFSRQKQGERLISEMKTRKIKRFDLIDLIGYEPNVQTISRWRTGESPLPDDVARTLSDVWGIRIEYLQGIDDYKTDDERNKAMRADDLFAFRECLAYLRTVGITIEPCIYADFWMDELYDYFPAYRDDLTAQSLSDLTAQYDFGLDRNAFMNTYNNMFEEWGTVDDFKEWFYANQDDPQTWERVDAMKLPTVRAFFVRDPAGVKLDDLEMLGKRQQVNAENTLPDPNDPDAYSFIDTQTGYNVYKHGVFLAFWSPSDLQRTMQQLDAVTVSLIENA